MIQFGPYRWFDQNLTHGVDFNSKDQIESFLRK